MTADRLSDTDTKPKPAGVSSEVAKRDLVVKHLVGRLAQARKPREILIPQRLREKILNVIPDGERFQPHQAGRIGQRAQGDNRGFRRQVHANRDAWSRQR